MSEKSEVGKENAGNWYVPSNPEKYGESDTDWDSGVNGVADAPDSHFLFVQKEAPPSTRLCPHHMLNGDVNKNGAISAYGAIKGARGATLGDELPEDVIDKGLSHLEDHYTEFEMKFPEQDGKKEKKEEPS